MARHSIRDRRKLLSPQLASRSSWKRLRRLPIASLGARARSLDRRRRSRSRTSGPGGFACRCKCGCANWLCLRDGIDSRVRGRDFVSLKVRGFGHCDQVASRAIVMQRTTQRPVQFDVTQPTGDAVQKSINQAGPRSEDFLSPSRIRESPHLGIRQAREDPGPVVRRTGPRCGGLRDPLDAAHQGSADLSPHQGPACRSAAGHCIGCKVPCVTWASRSTLRTLEITKQTEV
jgi:hypothetical protein